MKQYITKEQWNEITDEQKFYFLDNGKPIKERCQVLDELSLRISNELFPDIGQMIEFLGSDWWMNLVEPLGKNYDLNCALNGEYLCNQLWEAVKNKLKK